MQMYNYLVETNVVSQVESDDIIIHLLHR